MGRRLILAGISAVCLSAVACSPSVRPKSARILNIAVAELSAQNVSAGDAAVMADLLRGELVNTGAFRVVEKQNMDKVLAEQAFQQTGCTSEECAVKLGRILNVQRMIVGSFGKTLGVYVFSIRVVNVESGEVICGQRAKGVDMKEIEAGIIRMAKAVATSCEPVAPAREEPARTSQPKAAPVPLPKPIPQAVQAPETPPAAPGQDNAPLKTFSYGADVVAVGFSPDGKTILTSSYKKTIWFWDVESGMQAGSLEGNEDSNFTAVFSPNGKYVLVGSGDGSADVWNVQSRSKVRTVQAHPGGVRAVAFTADSYRFVTGGYGATAKLWNVATGALLRTFSGHGDVVAGVACSADGRRLATSSDDGTAKVWELETGRELGTFRVAGRYANAVDISGDGRKLIAGALGIVKIWDVDTGAVLQDLKGHGVGGGVYSAKFSKDGKLALTGGEDRTARLWDVATGRDLRVFPGHHWAWGAPDSVAFSPDGKSVLIGCGDGNARLWDIAGIAGGQAAPAATPPGIEIGDGGVFAHLKSSNDVVFHPENYRGPRSFSAEVSGRWDPAKRELVIEYAVTDDTPVWSRTPPADIEATDHCELWICGLDNRSVIQWGISPGDFKGVKPYIHQWLPRRADPVPGVTVYAWLIPGGYRVNAIIAGGFLLDSAGTPRHLNACFSVFDARNASNTKDVCMIATSPAYRWKKCETFNPLVLK